MKQPVWVEKDALLLLHAKSLARFGGAEGVRDHGLLESALARWVSRSRRAGDDLRIEFGDTAPVVMLEKGARR